MTVRTKKIIVPALRRVWPVETSLGFELVLSTVPTMLNATPAMRIIRNAWGLRSGLGERRLPPLPPAITSLFDGQYKDASRS